MGTLVENRELVNMAESHARSKRHFEIAHLVKSEPVTGIELSSHDQNELTLEEAK